MAAVTGLAKQDGDAERPVMVLSLTLLSALLAVGCVGFGTNLSIQLINLGMHASGASPWSIGLSTMIQALGIVIAAPLAPSFMRRFGVRGAMVIGAVIAGLMMLALPRASGFFAVGSLRFLYAIGLALVFTCAEFTILANTDRTHRGLAAGMYATALGIGMIAGPLTLSSLGVDSMAAVYVSAAACFACVPVALLGLSWCSPLRERRAKRRVSLVGVSPLAFGAAFAFGFLDNGPVSLLGVFSMGKGWSAQEAAALVSVVTLSAILCQTPIGWAVDQVETRTVVLTGCVMAGMLLIFLPWLWSTPVLALMSVFVLGAVMEGLYTVGLADLGKRVDGAELSSANAFFVMVCGIGEVVGPLATGFALTIAA